MKETVALRVKYEGQLYQIDAGTLLVSLLHFTEALKLVARRIAKEDLQIRISSTEKGSFIVYLEIAKKAVFGFLSDHGAAIDTLYKIIGTLVGILTLKKFLSGKKPDEIVVEGGRVIVSKDGVRIVVDENIFNTYRKDSGVNQHIEKMFEPLSEDAEVDGVGIESGETESFYVDRSNFHGMCQENELLEEGKEKELRENVSLAVVKIVFQKNRKWEFIYEGNKISAYVEDEQFWQRVNSGELQFSKGDLLIADVEVTKVFDSEIGCYVNKSYKVTRVISHNPRIGFQQGELSF